MRRVHFGDQLETPHKRGRAKRRRWCGGCMSGKIFFNCRRDDDPGYTQALYQRLEDEFASADLFMDVEGSIKPGDDFVEVLGAQVGACDVMLAIIGPRWSELLANRLNDPPSR
jgi:hypothetical protein